MTLRSGIDITLSWRPHQGKPGDNMWSYRVLTATEDWSNIVDTRDEAVRRALKLCDEIAAKYGRILP